jgi:hypothetical protein
LVSKDPEEFLFRKNSPGDIVLHPQKSFGRLWPHYGICADYGKLKKKSMFIGRCVDTQEIGFFCWYLPQILQRGTRGGTKF